MNNFFKFSIGLGILLANLMLSSCIVPATVIQKNPNYQLNPSADTGSVAFSTFCASVLPIEIALTRNDDAPDIVQGLMRPQYRPINLSCGSQVSDFIMLNLPVGKYEIYRFAPSDTMSTQYIGFNFEVYPNKVNYIGGIVIIFEKKPFKMRELFSNEYGKGKVTLIDFSKRDLPVFMNKYRNIPSDRYVVNLAKPRIIQK